MNLALGKPGKVPFGDDAMGWLYLGDAARATLLIDKATRTKTRAFTIGGDIHLLKEVADSVKQLLPSADISVLPSYLGINWKFDTEPLEKEVGYHRKWPMKQGIKETTNIVRQEHGLPLV